MYIYSIQMLDSNGSKRYNINLNNQINIVPKELISLKELAPFLNFIFYKEDNLSLNPKQLFDNLTERLKIPNSDSLKNSKINEIIFYNYNVSKEVISLNPNKQSFINSSKQFWKNKNTTLNIPLLAFYSKELIIPCNFFSRKLDEILKAGYGLGQPEGYYKWNDSQKCHLLWRRIFKMHVINNLSTPSNTYELRYLTIMNNCLNTLTHNINNNDFRINLLSLKYENLKEEIICILDNGNELTLDSFPENLKFLVYIVFDLVNRSFLLNNSRYSSGICLIDDFVKNIGTLDPHLILNALHMTFPKIQFLVNV